MQTFTFTGKQEDGKPLGQWPGFYRAVNEYDAAYVRVLDADEYHTDRQRRWYKGVCLRGLSDWNGDTEGEWDTRLKILCGAELLKLSELEYNGNTVLIPASITTLSKKKMTQFIENILAKAIEMNWPVYPPDPELRGY